MERRIRVADRAQAPRPTEARLPALREASLIGGLDRVVLRPESGPRRVDDADAPVRTQEVGLDRAGSGNRARGERRILVLRQVRGAEVGCIQIERALDRRYP